MQRQAVGVAGEQRGTGGGGGEAGGRCAWFATLLVLVPLLAADVGSRIGRVDAAQRVSVLLCGLSGWAGAAAVQAAAGGVDEAGFACGLPGARGVVRAAEPASEAGRRLAFALRAIPPPAA